MSLKEEKTICERRHEALLAERQALVDEGADKDPARKIELRLVSRELKAVSRQIQSLGKQIEEAENALVK